MDYFYSFLEWAWARHHNEWSWYVRPLFLFALCFFAWRKSWAGVLLTLVLFPTSLFWFPAPESPAPHVVGYLAWERSFFFEGRPWVQGALAVAVAVYLWALTAALWHRSWRLGLLVINVGVCVEDRG